MSAIGETLAGGRETFTDRKSGLTVTRYTAGGSHVSPIYFNISGAWDGDRRTVVVRDVDGIPELASLDLASGEQVRLTAGGARGAAVCPVREEAYYHRGDAYWAIHLRHGECRRVATIPAGLVGHHCQPNADGSRLVTILSEPTGLGNAVSTEAKQDRNALALEGRISSVPLEGGEFTTHHATRCHELGHANPSPTDPDLMTFCHEGPWLEIDQRIWGLRLSGGDPWPILPKEPDWGVGHEFWFDDGLTLGYHARYREGTWRHALGWVTADNHERFQAECAVPTHHTHARSRDRYILDGTRESGDYLLVVDRDGEGWAPPRVLCAHDASRHGHHVHAHPHLMADGRTVIFGSDREGYADVYAVAIPEDLGRLPVYEGPPYRYYWE